VYVIVGLGNPGKKYELTRHNIGFRIVDYIAHEYIIPFKSGKGDYYFAEISRKRKRILLVKPAAFMNESGLAVYQILKYFPISIKDILIVYDDYYLPFGTLRFRPDGSDGGHNGLKSIIYHLHSKKFDRLRFGIGSDFDESVSFVLSKFSKVEEKKINNLISTAINSIDHWMDEGIESSMNEYNKIHL
jgi:PTH1 family peptidyl-tRNA hydrolase